MAKIDNPADAAIMPLHKTLMKMCGRTGYTPEPVKILVNGLNLDGLAWIWKITKDRRL